MDLMRIRLTRESSPLQAHWATTRNLIPDDDAEFHTKAEAKKGLHGELPEPLIKSRKSKTFYKSENLLFGSRESEERK